MNIVILLLIIIVTKGDSFVINTKKSNVTESVLIRKLQNFQKQNDQEVTTIQPWNEILAEVIINKIKLIPFHKENDQNIENPEGSIPNFFVKTLSYLLKMYKTHVYDRWNKNVVVDYIPQPPEIPDVPQENPSVPKVSDEPTLLNPKEDVEIIEPEYHGKLCDNCTEMPVDAICPDGFQLDDKGDCVDSKASKFILRVPRQCPIGYRLDWYGFCRERF